MPKFLLVVIILVLIAAAVWFAFLIFGGSGTSENQSEGTVNSFTIQNMRVDTQKAGDGNGAQIGNTLVVNYITMLESGKKIDSSYNRGNTFSFKLGGNEVIKAWDLGLIGMKVGEKRKLTAPPDLAYGTFGFAAAGIPENATLVFEVELLEIH